MDHQHKDPPAGSSHHRWQVGDTVILNTAFTSQEDGGGCRNLTDAITVVGTIKAIKPHIDRSSWGMFRQGEVVDSLKIQDDELRLRGMTFHECLQRKAVWMAAAQKKSDTKTAGDTVAEGPSLVDVAPENTSYFYAYFATKQIYPYNVISGDRLPPPPGYSAKHWERQAVSDAKVAQAVTSMGDLTLGQTAIYGHERFSYRFDGWYPLPVDPSRSVLLCNDDDDSSQLSTSFISLPTHLLEETTTLRKSGSTRGSGTRREASESAKQPSVSTAKDAKTLTGDDKLENSTKNGNDNDDEKNIVGSSEFDSDAPFDSFTDMAYFGYHIDPWFRAPFSKAKWFDQPSKALQEKHCFSLHVCHRCLMGFPTWWQLTEHLAGLCTLSRPPGATLYKQPYKVHASTKTAPAGVGSDDFAPIGDENYLRVRMVDGSKERQYCYNLCMLGRCFVESKSLSEDVDVYEFFTVTLTRGALPHPAGNKATLLDQQRWKARVSRHDVDKWAGGEVVVGYWCRVKHTKDLCLNVICVFPPFQGLGLGSFMLRAAYYLVNLRQTICGCEELCGVQVRHVAVHENNEETGERAASTTKTDEVAASVGGGKISEPFSHAGHRLVYPFILKWLNTEVANYEAMLELKRRAAAVEEEEDNSHSDGDDISMDVQELLSLCPGLHIADLLGALQWKQRLLYVAHNYNKLPDSSQLLFPTQQQQHQPPQRQSGPRDASLHADTNTDDGDGAAVRPTVHHTSVRYGAVIDDEATDVTHPPRVPFNERYLICEDKQNASKLHDVAVLERKRDLGVLGTDTAVIHGYSLKRAEMDAEGLAGNNSSSVAPTRDGGCVVGAHRLVPLYTKYIHFGSSNPLGGKNAMSGMQRV